jgi:hypothetical protein
MRLRFGPHEQLEPVASTERTEAMSRFFVVGVDLGNMADSTAITVLEVSRAWEISYLTAPFENIPKETRRKAELSFLVRLLHRPRIGVGFPAIIDQVRAILEDLPAMPEKPSLIVDATGLGAPVVQRMREMSMRPIGLTITGGNTAALTGRDWSCPKGLLVGELRLAMHRKLLRVAQGFAARETLQAELAAFTARLSPSGRATFEAAGSEHDDTVLSLALAVLAAKHRPTEVRVYQNYGLMER